MNGQAPAQPFWKNDWTIGLVLLLVFLLTNGYAFPWDDQHLEVPLLKSLIDPQIYVGDYYVESLKVNFLSWLYPLLARVITVGQIPAAYLILYLLARYFFFLWMFKFWRLVTGDRITAALCVLSVFLLARVDEFLYRTFSHQELALAIVMAGLYYFYKERFVLAAALMGIAANIHALYSFFAWVYLMLFLARHVREYRMTTLIKAFSAYWFCALPLLGLIVNKHLAQTLHPPEFFNGWFDLYLISCPANFIFDNQRLADVFKNLPSFFQASKTYWLLLVLYLLNRNFNDRFRADHKGRLIINAGFGMLCFSYVFTYLLPARFVLDLNLVRNTQFIHFLLTGYTTLLLWNAATQAPRWVLPISGIMFYLLRFPDDIAVMAAAFLFLIFLLNERVLPLKGKTLALGLCLWVPVVMVTLYLLVSQFLAHRFILSARISLAAVLGSTAAVALGMFWVKNRPWSSLLKRALVIIPLMVNLISFTYYHHNHLQIEKTGGGFWQMQRNWIDMQHYVRQHTPVDALLMVPYDMEMGGFRIFSERKIICSYRDCGIIGFDYAAAKEWQKRVKDIEPFKVIADKPIVPALLNALLKYKVNYIVFMGYLDPGRNEALEPMYKNEVFALYRVVSNPTSRRESP